MWLGLNQLSMDLIMIGFGGFSQLFPGVVAVDALELAELLQVTEQHAEVITLLRELVRLAHRAALPAAATRPRHLAPYARSASPGSAELTC